MSRLVVVATGGTIATSADTEGVLRPVHGGADLASGLGAEYERYWNVAYPIDAINDANGNGVPDSVRIAVIVRWQHGNGWRRVVLMGSIHNPAEF